jgi:hypothetical protein
VCLVDIPGNGRGGSGDNQSHSENKIAHEFPFLVLEQGHQND